MRIPKTLAIVLAGGKGSRLGALTDARVKPALPVAGTYRLIDIALSNLAHSHLSDVWIIEQYLPQSLNDHLAGGRPWDLDRSHGGLQVIAPFEGGPGEGFAEGNSDALWRARDRIRAFDPELVLILSADHLYTANFLDVIGTHVDQRADLTIVSTRRAEDPSRHDVLEVAENGTVTALHHKPDDPVADLVSAEVYCYSARPLLDDVDLLHRERSGLGDQGQDLLPHFVANRRTVHHPLDGYWRDVGTIASYWQAHMELLDGSGATLDDPSWPIYSAQPQLLPARVAAGAAVSDSLVSAGTTVAGVVSHSVIGPGAVIEAGAKVVDSLILDGATIGEGVELRNCIVDIGATLTRAGRRGSTGTVTLIGQDGLVADRQPLG